MTAMIEWLGHFIPRRKVPQQTELGKRLAQAVAAAFVNDRKGKGYVDADELIWELDHPLFQETVLTSLRAAAC